MAAVKEVTVTHESGDTISESNVKITVAGSPAVAVDYSTASNETSVPWGSSNDISAGSSATVRAVYTGSTPADISSGSMSYDSSGSSTAADYRTLSSDDTIRIIYYSPDTDSSSTLGTFTVQ